MNIKVTKEQLEKIVKVNEDYGLTDEELLNMPFKTMISTNGQALYLGKIKKRNLDALRSIVNTMNLQDGTKIFVDFHE